MPSSHSAATKHVSRVTHLHLMSACSIFYLYQKNPFKIKKRLMMQVMWHPSLFLQLTFFFETRRWSYSFSDSFSTMHIYICQDSRMLRTWISVNAHIQYMCLSCGNKTKRDNSNDMAYIPEPSDMKLYIVCSVSFCLFPSHIKWWTTFMYGVGVYSPNVGLP